MPAAPAEPPSSGGGEEPEDPSLPDRETPDAPQQGGPTLIIQNGDAGLAPLLLGLLFFAAVAAVSGPVSRWIAGKLPLAEKEEEQEDGEEEE